MAKKTIRAVIFDMDGVISDTEKVISEVTSGLLAENGIEMAAQEIARQYAGVSDRETLRQILQTRGRKDIDIDKLLEEKLRRIRTAFKNNIRAVDGTAEFIDKLSVLGLPLAVGSASRFEFIDLILSELGLKSKFAAIAGIDEAKKGKPDPDIFLLAAKKLAIRPQDCLVVEDAFNGMLAAKAAGMECVGLVREDLGQKYPAGLLVKTLGDKKIWDKYNFMK